MSTEFTDTLTGEVAFVRWGRGRGRVGFEFGTVTNFERVRSLVEMGASFDHDGNGWQGNSPEDFTAEGLDRMVADGSATFGEFPVTVAVGSDMQWRFTQEDS